MIIIIIITYTDLVNNKHTLTWNYLQNAKFTLI